MSKYKIFIQGSLNDVTQNYVSIVVAALQSQNIACEYIYDKVEKIDPNDIVIVIDSAAFRVVYCHNRKQRIVSWAQGIFPEETDLTYPKGLKQCARKLYWRIQERRMILKSEFLFFISHAMVRHYRKTYNYKGDNYFVMPCFNMELDKEAFSVATKYSSPTFLYAGGLNAWQCVTEALTVYKEVKKRLPLAKFTLLTHQKNQAYELVAKLGVPEVEIRSVPLKDMVEEQRKYKYGFLLREDIDVNRVATPTKLNSYMASGIIPILSNVVESFKENLGGIKYLIQVESLKNPKIVAEQIIEYESNAIVPAEILAQYEELFSTYYNKEHYIEQFKYKLPQ